MVRERALLAGMTDYTGVSIEDILSHLRDWLRMTNEAMVKLQTLRADVQRQPQMFESPDSVLLYVDGFCDLFTRYASDFQRLVNEIPGGVRESHIEIVTQLYRSSKHEEEYCVEFKKEFIQHSLDDERARPYLDAIYQETRGTIIDYRDLSNLVPRLRTFVASGAGQGDMVELKPAFWGISINLKAVWRRFRERWQKPPA